MDVEGHGSETGAALARRRRRARAGGRDWMQQPWSEWGRTNKVNQRGRRLAHEEELSLSFAQRIPLPERFFPVTWRSNRHQDARASSDGQKGVRAESQKIGRLALIIWVNKRGAENNGRVISSFLDPDQVIKNRQGNSFLSVSEVNLL